MRKPLARVELSLLEAVLRAKLQGDAGLMTKLDGLFYTARMAIGADKPVLAKETAAESQESWDAVDAPLQKDWLGFELELYARLGQSRELKQFIAHARAGRKLPTTPYVCVSAEVPRILRKLLELRRQRNASETGLTDWLPADFSATEAKAWMDAEGAVSILPIGYDAAVSPAVDDATVPGPDSVEQRHLQTARNAKPRLLERRNSVPVVRPDGSPLERRVAERRHRDEGGQSRVPGSERRSPNIKSER